MFWSRWTPGAAIQVDETARLPGRLESIAGAAYAILNAQQRDWADADRQPADRWKLLSGRVDQVCGLIEKAAGAFAESVRQAPSESSAIQRAGAALSHACVVRGEADGIPGRREQDAIEAAFESYLDQTLDGIAETRTHLRRFDRLKTAIWGLGFLAIAGVFLASTTRLGRRRKAKL